MRADFFRETRFDPVASKRIFDPIALDEAAWLLTDRDKQGLLLIPTLGEVALQPEQGLIGEKQRPLLVALANDLGLFAHPVHIATV
jgi:hypothetical protein